MKLFQYSKFAKKKGFESQEKQKKNGFRKYMRLIKINYNFFFFFQRKYGKENGRKYFIHRRLQKSQENQFHKIFRK